MNIARKYIRVALESTDYIICSPSCFRRFGLMRLTFSHTLALSFDLTLHFHHHRLPICQELLKKLEEDECKNKAMLDVTML